MSEIYLDPDKFQSQIDSYESGAETIAALNYSASTGSGALRSLDKYAECMTQFNETVKLFAQMMENDTLSMKKIKAAWMNTDSESATMTWGESIISAISD